MHQKCSSNSHFYLLGVGLGDFHVSEAIHKAKIEISEKGTKASAATGMFKRGSATLGSHCCPHLPVRFIQFNFHTLQLPTENPKA